MILLYYFDWNQIQGPIYYKTEYDLPIDASCLLAKGTQLFVEMHIYVCLLLICKITTEILVEFNYFSVNMHDISLVQMNAF